LPDTKLTQPPFFLTHTKFNKVVSKKLAWFVKSVARTTREKAGQTLLLIVQTAARYREL
jgi:hypothetical protein